MQTLQQFGKIQVFKYLQLSYKRGYAKFQANFATAFG